MGRFEREEDEDLIDRGEYKGQSVEVSPIGAEWVDATDANGNILENGKGHYKWEYECPVCRVFYYTGPEARKLECDYCEITHVCRGAASCQTPRRVAPERKIPASKAA